MCIDYPIKFAVIYVDGDGQTEVIVAYADRVVRCFRWSAVLDIETTDGSPGTLMQSAKWQLAGQVSKGTNNMFLEKPVIFCILVRIKNFVNKQKL